jgi:hypothetical protein
VVHVNEHDPPEHVVAPFETDGHAWPQVPQLLTSVCSLTQAPLHDV